MPQSLLTPILIFLHAGFPTEPVHFKLDKIEIEGAEPPLLRMVERALNLEAGRTYPESSLKRALGRIDRLPPVHDVHFQLEKGFERGGYLLRITLKTRCPRRIAHHRARIT
ncbi:MAG: hypothetical protein QNK37_02755 [Acidobacteriota bacterium]|nr:hypothetical protein [Acidobacteriota bacterium]